MGLFHRKEKEATEVKAAPITASANKKASCDAYCFLHKDEERIAVLQTNHDFELATKTLYMKGLGGRRIYKYFYKYEDVTIERDPKNEADKNAVKILVNGQFYGYVNRNDAPALGKAIKKGMIEKCAIIMVGGPYRYIISEDQSTAGFQDEKITLEVTFK